MSPEDEKQSLIDDILDRARKYAFDFHYVEKEDEWTIYKKEFFKRIKYIGTDDLKHSNWQMDNIMVLLDDIEDEMKEEAGPALEPPPNGPPEPGPSPANQNPGNASNNIDPNKIKDNIQKLKNQDDRQPGGFDK